jgi:hypothetical protein
MKKTQKTRIEEKIVRIQNEIEEIEDSVSRVVKSAIEKVGTLKHSLIEMEKKDSLTFDEVRQIEPRYYGAADTLMIGKRKWRISCDDAKVEFEKSSDSVIVSIYSDEYSRFHIPANQMKGLATWLNDGPVVHPSRGKKFGKR